MIHTLNKKAVDMPYWSYIVALVIGLIVIVFIFYAIGQAQNSNSTVLTFLEGVF